MNNNNESVHTVIVKAGRNRTYFIDTKPTKNNDYKVVITESRREEGDEPRYRKDRIVLFKEDYIKFLNALNRSLENMRTKLLPNYDFEQGYTK